MNRIVRERISEYAPRSLQEEENALKEVSQELVLYSLSLQNFFRKAVFHGGTALRILHGLPRFSEDLDFLLKVPDKDFEWKPFTP